MQFATDDFLPAWLVPVEKWTIETYSGINFVVKILTRVVTPRARL
jgi:hypothetical protein